VTADLAAKSLVTLAERVQGAHARHLHPEQLLDRSRDLELGRPGIDAENHLIPLFGDQVPFSVMTGAFKTRSRLIIATAAPR